jgi:hypothetical protein
MWHDGTLLYEVTAKDSRLTYWPMQFASTMAGYGVVKVDGVNSAFAADYSVLNVPFADDKLGRSQFILDLEVSGDTCDVIDERTGNKYTVASSGSYFNLLNDIKISLGNIESVLMISLPCSSRIKVFTMPIISPALEAFACASFMNISNG